MLEGIARTGTTPDTINFVAETLNISPDDVERRVHTGKGGMRSHFKRKVRWIQQTLKQQGLSERTGQGVWVITEKGQRTLHQIQGQHADCLFATPYGLVLWTDGQNLPSLFRHQIDLLIVSPPYPLNSPRPYGNETEEQKYIDRFAGWVEDWLQLLRAPASSLVINLGDVWEPRIPAQSLYKERLVLMLNDRFGLKLCQRFVWHNPARPATSGGWYVANQRIRVKPSTESVWWLSQDPAHAYADNRQVLEPYAPETIELIKTGGMKQQQVTPSGHMKAPGGYSRNNGGKIPSNLLEIAHESSNSTYIRACKEHGLPIHPARFPSALVEFFIRFLTQRGDAVADPMAGSCVTGQVAEALERYWVCADNIKEYLLGGIAGRLQPLTSK